MRALHFAALFFLTLGNFSCSSYSIFGNRERLGEEVFEKSFSEDYAEHLNFQGNTYLTSPDVKVYDLSKKNKNYFRSIYKKIVENNELILHQKGALEVTIIQSDVPFYFSLPGAKFFFSRGLLKNYIKNEGMLVACFSYEILKSLRLLYPKRLAFPKGYIRTEEMLSLTRLPFKARIELHKWAFNILKRSNFDPYGYLIWLQIQNKNPLDFSFQHGHNNRMIREEYFLKNYILKEVGYLKKRQLVEKNSSHEFKANEIFKASDLMVDSLTQLIASKRIKED